MWVNECLVYNKIKKEQMQTETVPLNFIQSPNGKQMKKESPWQTVLATIAASGTIGCFVFLWNLNGTMARMQERDMERAKGMDEINGKINTMQLDIRDLRDKTIRIETLKTH